ncbi:hypothetical protein HanRHA438_Chr11g0485651 [Helianthus annuus]|uniref:Uncharacterized protein n=1 Tax=Helianthus annuus TaxID=4232 RepID=A0A251T858_HELAN|nr:hypothetical protein HanXRQr2_Chr11g0472051 [Helianthus annuus]KAJ0869118.1 hypothetical protein HanRHA438_Chr11g0485651 [Helianthus annuus]
MKLQLLPHLPLFTSALYLPTNNSLPATSVLLLPLSNSDIRSFFLHGGPSSSTLQQ